MTNLKQVMVETDSQRKHRRNENHAPIYFTQVVNSMRFTTLTHLSEVLYMNMVDIKSHSTDKMKTVRRKRQKRGV